MKPTPMKKKPLLVLFGILALHLPIGALQTSQTDAHPAMQSGQSLPAADSTLPQAASPLPLLSTIGAGILLGGLVSARRTRSQK